VRSGPGKTAKNQKKKKKKKYSVSSKKKSTVMSPIRRRMKKGNPSSGQNGQLVHWWLLIHSGRLNVLMDDGHLSNIKKLEKKKSGATPLT
jgi:prepilin-type processing-associated H-X9-DG protein